AAARGLARQPHHLPVLDAGGHLDRQRLAVHGHVHRAAQRRRLERDADLRLDVLGGLRPGPPPPAAAAEHLAHAAVAAAAEEMTHDLLGLVRVHAGKVEALRPAVAAPAERERLGPLFTAAAASREASPGADEAEAVVLGALGLVGEDVIGVLD